MLAHLKIYFEKTTHASVSMVFSKDFTRPTNLIDKTKKSICKDLCGLADKKKKVCISAPQRHGAEAFWEAF